MGVGDRRQSAATGVTSRSRHSAGTARADLEYTGFIDPGDRAATGTDLDQIEHGAPDRIATDVAPVHQPIGIELRYHFGLAVADHARFCGGAAHVECDQI